jgi:integrase/recombinase XerD
MTTIPSITIYVRHSAGCKNEADELAKRCDCRKWLRWTTGGVRQRRKANTRSWAEAERVRRELEDQLTGSGIAATTTRDLPSAISLYITDKTVQGVAEDTVSTYQRELDRLCQFCDRQMVLTVQGINRELLTKYMATWEAIYPSSVTRSKVRERLRGFLRYCYEAEWLPRIPVLPKIKVASVPTLPLTPEQFDHLLDSIAVGLPNDQSGKARVKLRALFLLMRWSGLAIGDALQLERAQITLRGGVYRVVTSRQKTGVDVSVPLPPHVAREVLAVPNDANPSYLF